MPKPRVLLDSCVIIEAFRTSTWNALSKHFSVETVDCCLTECSTGDPLQPGRVPIPLDSLRAGLTAVHQVDEAMLASLALDFPNLPALDLGEQHLLAWLHANPGDAILTVLSTADRAAVRGSYVLNILDRVSSLEDLARQAGVGSRQLRSLHGHFHEDWLAQLRMQLRSGVL